MITTRPMNSVASVVINPTAETMRKLMHNEKGWVRSFTEWVLSKLGVVEKGSVSDFKRSVSLLKISSNADRKLLTLPQTVTSVTCTKVLSCQKKKAEAEKAFYRALSDRCARTGIKDQTQLYPVVRALFEQKGIIQDLAQPALSEKQFKNRISQYWPKEGNSKRIAWSRVASITAKVGIGALLAYGAYSTLSVVSTWLSSGSVPVAAKGSTAPNSNTPLTQTATNALPDNLKTTNDAEVYQISNPLDTRTASNPNVSLTQTLPSITKDTNKSLPTRLTSIFSNKPYKVGIFSTNPGKGQPEALTSFADFATNTVLPATQAALSQITGVIKKKWPCIVADSLAVVIAVSGFKKARKHEAECLAFMRNLPTTNPNVMRLLNEHINGFAQLNTKKQLEALRNFKTKATERLSHNLALEKRTVLEKILAAT